MKKENHWGFIDTKGNMVIPEQFYETKPFHNGLAVVKDPSFRWGVIDKTGKCVIPFEYSEMEADGDLFLVKKGDKAGLVEDMRQVFRTGDRNYTVEQAWTAWQSLCDKWGRYYRSFRRRRDDASYKSYFTYLNYDWSI